MKKGMRLGVSLLLVIVLIVSNLAGCSNEKSSETNNSGQATQAAKEDQYTQRTEAGGEYDTAEEPYPSETANIYSDSKSKDFLEDADYGYNAKMEYESQFNTEEYNAIAENNFKSVQDNPLSTFSIDVDTASYSNVRRMLYNNQTVVPDAVRIEEMINYFHYDYQKPRGEEPFSVTTELSDCPWNKEAKLLLIGLQAQEIDMEERPSTNLVFLLDVSGSMDEEDKLPLMQKAFVLLTENLTEKDRVSIVTYAGYESVVLEGARGNETGKIVNAIENLSAGGSTAGAAGIMKAYQLAEEYFIKGGNNRVILATDGDLNVGVTSEGELTRLIKEKKESGVFLSVLGFGTGNIKDNKMEALADNGNGNYAYIDSLLEAKKVLVEEMGGTLYTVAKDVKLQVEFNPARIGSYRLIGYENRALNTEDFNDDTKDAGEIGAGHRVTALYELIGIDSKQPVSTTDLKYQSGNSDTSNREFNEELLTINIRYKEPDGNKSKLLSVPVMDRAYTRVMPKNLAFASSVAAFGMILRDSEFKGDASLNMVLELLKEYNYSNDEYKDEFISLVKMMKRYS
ncbi:vWA domain-containing protein [Anaerocolumna sp.]|uniref:vWA domain-containing protein n=1 Tax=Anaerocolumna sp. TaxID=2041569 RepID=UPI0028B23D75|nr:von Willebrand factor type A domain-containing protein [Anaerocolumna sp.]